jgi:hypothetical protein
MLLANSFYFFVDCLVFALFWLEIIPLIFVVPFFLHRIQMLVAGYLKFRSKGSGAGIQKKRIKVE